MGKIVECNFFGTISDPDTAKRVGRTTNAFRGNDFREADLIWVGFQEIDLDAQRWPESNDYAILRDPPARIEAAIEKARATLAGDDLNRVVSALAVLAPILEEVAGWERFRIRGFFEANGMLIQEWERVRTDWLTVRPATIEPEETASVPAERGDKVHIVPSGT